MVAKCDEDCINVTRFDSPELVQCIRTIAEASRDDEEFISPRRRGLLDIETPLRC